MSFGIDKLNITNPEIVKKAEDIAKQADDSDNGNKNGSLDTKEEIILFQKKISEAFQNGEIPSEEFLALMNADLSETKSVTEEDDGNKKDEENKNVTPVINNSTERTGRKTPGTRLHFNRDLKDKFDCNFSMEDAVEKLATETYTDAGSAETVRVVRQMVQDIKEADPQTLGDISRIRTIEFERHGYPVKFRTIYNTLVNQAKREMQVAHAQELKEKYQEIKSDEVKDGENPNFTALKKETLDEMGRSNYTASERRLFKKAVKDDAIAYLEGKLDDTKNHTSYSIREKELKKSDTADDYIEKSARRAIKWQAGISAKKNRRDYRYEVLASVTDRDIRYGIKNADALGDHTTEGELGLGSELYYKLYRAYLDNPNKPYVKNSDGTYNLQKLADAVNYRTGADATVNRSSDTEQSEIDNARYEIHKETGIPEDALSDSDVIKIAKMCGNRIEPKEHNLAGVLPFVGADILEELRLGFNNKGELIYIGGDVINFTLTSSKEIQTMIKAETITVDEVIKIENIIKGMIKKGDITVVINPENWVKLLSPNALGLLASILLALAIGKDRQFEKSCISISDFDVNNSRYTNLTQYKEYVIDKFPRNQFKAAGLSALAASKMKNGKIDVAAQRSEINRYAGVASNINCEELWMLLHDVGKSKPSEQQPVIRKAVVQPLTPHYEEEKEVPDEKEAFIHYRKGGDSWGGIVRAYYPCLVQKYEKEYGKKYGISKAIKVLQRALCTDNGVFNEAQFKKLTSCSDVPKQILLPSKIEDCELDRNGKVIAVAISSSGNGQKVSYSSMASVGYKEKGTKKTTVQRTGETLWTAKDKEDNSISATGKTKEEAIEKLKNKNPNVKYEDKIEELK